MNDAQLQRLLDDTAARFGIVGAQLAIYDGRRREFVTGHRDRELGLPVTVQTLFQIGSTTKLFNAALIMSLVDAGRLDLPTPVRQYIDNFRLSDDEAEQSITLTHLLSMSAGLDNGTYHDYGRGDDALGRYVDGLEGIPHIFPAGSAFGYSNASTNIAGHVAASVMGQPWEQLLMQRIFAPLELQQSALFAEDLLLHPIALGYQRSASEAAARRIEGWPRARSMGPAGGLTCCSAGDLLKLGCMFLDQGKSASGVQVLSNAAVEALQRPQIKLPTRLFADAWCLGPFYKRWGKNIVYGHSGTNSGGSSTLLWCPEKKVAISTVVNVASQGYPLANAIFEVVFPQLFGIEKPVTVTPERATAVDADLHPYIGRFEAFGMALHIFTEGGKLKLNGRIWSSLVTDCELIPLGDGRFLPRDPTVSGNRNWDIAFWGSDASGRATHLLQGVFPLRRTS
jgi:CubicO group peptidase (beta-lactamase class C family)